jgi:BirA family biotin operon repressor/biotin-[acetyl-CoA-carboxylase] ligase
MAMADHDSQGQRGGWPDLTVQAIVSQLESLGARIGRPLVVLSRTPSTNDEARRAAASGAPHGAAFIAEEQTGGRGRGSNQWHSPRGENIYLSVVLRPDLEPSAIAPLALAAGVAVAQVVDGELVDPRALLKWPNDVYVDARKIAGVLVEASTRPGQSPVVVVGIGLNVGSERFPGPLAETATSLELAGAQALDRNAIAGRLLTGLGEVTTAYLERGMAALTTELSQRNFLQGRPVVVGEVAGLAQGIDEQGRLLVCREDGEILPICSGEVAWQ